MEGFNICNSSHSLLPAPTPTCPPCACRCAEFLTSSGGAVAAGVVFGVLIPLALVAASFSLTMRYVSSGARSHQVMRKAAAALHWYARARSTRLICLLKCTTTLVAQ